MKLSKLVLVASTAVLFSACSSMGNKALDTKVESPTPPAKDQTLPVPGKVAASLTIDVPNWYLKAPPSDDNYVFVAGTGLSSDLGMSNEKAALDAQRKLADKINGVVSALVKTNKTDSGGEAGVDVTTLAVKKLILNTPITGFHIEDSKIVAENKAYRTFVLVRYPIGDANRILKEKLKMDNTRNVNLFKQGLDELDREIDASKKKEAE